MPRTARYTLTWLSRSQNYELRENQLLLDIIPEGPSWLAWIGRVSSFSFQGRGGSYTVCKEHKQRGDGYWYAYARVQGKMVKRYLGRDVNLTLARMEEISQQFWQNHSRTAQGRSREENGNSTLTALPLDPLLATKLYVPRPRPRLLHRARLVQRLQQVTEHALTLLSAPVGFGKSTLLSDWLSTYPCTIAWLTLDPQDNDITRFLSYLFASLQSELPSPSHSGGEQSASLSSLEAMLTLLINDQTLRRLKRQEHIVLVLDNYYAIADPSIHYALTFLLEHLPPMMHIVIATREDPPLPLAQLRGRGNLLELRAADLRFTQEEAVTFLLDVMGLPISEEEGHLLHARTEGWITGLLLAAFSLQDHTASKSFITAFSGSHRYVVDYLLEEVLHRQSETVQNFLLQTCILDRLCAPLCDAVRKESGSQALLDYLERANLFLVALDDEGRWYRYHRLFAEALRQHVQLTSPVLVPELHRRAGLWYERQRPYTVLNSSHALPGSILPPGIPVEPLTAREREVLRLLLEGASNQEIAHALVLSMNTVKKHVLNICRKFQLRSRAQVIAKMRAYWTVEPSS